MNRFGYSRRAALIAIGAVGWTLLGNIGLAWTAEPATVATLSAPRLVVLGDSISAEYGLARDRGWVKLLGDRLHSERFDYSVVNASISGETTSGGRTRLPEILARTRPAIVIVELGGNDGLRGLSLAATEDNLAAIVRAAQNAGAKVLLVGMQLPPNYGKAYTERFANLFAVLAKRYRTALVPFFFEGFADKLEFFQADRIHPTEAAQGKLLDVVWPKLRPLLSDARGGARKS